MDKVEYICVNNKSTINVRHLFKPTLSCAVMILAMVAGTYSCSKKDSNARGAVPSCEITAGLDSLFNLALPGGDTPGGIVMVMRGDSLVYSRPFGMADIVRGTAITDSTLFNLSSASKMFTSVALQKLCEQGKISLDDSLSMYFPEFHDELFSHITIRHILTHSSGLPDLRPRNKSEWENYLSEHKSIFAQGEDYALYGDEDEHMLVFKSLRKAEFEPGTRYRRDDPAYILVAPLIERVTGVPFEDWMKENVFDAAGMKEAYYYTSDFDMPSVAHGYRLKDVSPDGNEIWEEYDYGEVPFFLTKADRGVYTSGRDFMQWIRALYSGKIVSDSSLKAIAVPYVPTDIPMVSFGLGTAVREEPGYPVKLYYMNTNGGFSVVEGMWPEERLCYLVFANRSDWNLHKVACDVDSILRASSFLKPAAK